MCSCSSWLQVVEIKQAALEASTSELMLFGLASLLLTILEDPIATICSELLTLIHPARVLAFHCHMHVVCQLCESHWRKIVD